MAQFKDGDHFTDPNTGTVYLRQGGAWHAQPQMLMQSPMAGPEVQKAQGEAVKAQNEGVASQYAPQTASAEARIKAAEAANALEVAQAQRDKAVAEAQTAKLNINAPKIDAATRKAAIQQYGFSKQLDETAANLAQLYAKGPGNTKGIFGAQDYLPLQGNTNFNNAANEARGIVGQTLGFTGGQLNTDNEAKRNIGPYIPGASDYDSTIEQKIQAMRHLAEKQRQTAIQTLGGMPDANGNIVPVGSQTSGREAVEQPQVGLNAGNKTRAQIDPVLQAVGQRVGHMLVAGAPDAQIVSFLHSQGVNPADTNIGQALQFRHTPDFQSFLKNNPGKAYPLGADFYTKQVPVGTTRALFNKAASTDLGGTVAAGLTASANAISGDRLGSLSGDPMAQTGMQLLRTQHPLASLGGDIAGQASLEGLAGLVPGGQALMASKWGRRGADALYGAYQGSGDDSGGDGLTGGLEGAALNIGGGMFGRGVQRGIGRTASGVKNQSLQYLDNLGIPLTLGQIGHGSDNVLGKFVGGVEDRLAGLPGTDAVINNARHRGITGFNQAAFKEAGGSGLTGGAGLDEVGQLRNNAYGFLNNASLPIDAQFAGRNAAVRAAIPAMPAFGNEVGKSIDLIDHTAAGGSLPGQDWQSAISDIRGNRSSIAGQPFARQAIGGMKGVESNLLDLAARQGPAGTVDNLNAANRLNGQVETLASALDNGPAQKADQLFTPGRLDDASRLNARNYGGRMNSLTGNRPFYNLTQAGNQVLPNVVKDSGTAGRMMLVPLMTGTLGSSIGAAAGSDDRTSGGKEGLEWGALAGLAAAGPYSKAGQKIIQKALLGDRPQAVQKIGDYLIANPRLSGMFGGNAARDYFLSQYLPQ